MAKATILLKNVDAVKQFVNITMQLDFDVDLASGRYVVDGKSIMGIFSLDLSKPIEVTAHSDNAGDFLAEISEFAAK